MQAIPAPASATALHAAPTSDEVAAYLDSSRLPASVTNDVTAKQPRSLLLGDSTMAALVWEPRAQVTLAGLDYVLDAESCRTISVPSCRGRTNPITGQRIIPDNGLQVLANLAPGAFDELVMMIGYDESSVTFAKSLPLVLDLARKKGFAHVTWLTFHVNGGYQPPLDGDASYRSNNAILAQAAGSSQGFLTMLDWNRYAEDIGGLIEPDGAHLTVAGAYAVGAFIHTAMEVLWVRSVSSEPAVLAHPQKSAVPAGYRLLSVTSRLLDTRSLGGRVAGSQAVRVDVPGGSALAGVSVNLTAVLPAAAGFLAAYSCTAAVPNISSLNVVKSQTRAASTLVALDVDGGFCVYSSARTDLLVDLQGTFDPASAGTVHGQPPTRVFDSRDGDVRLQANTSRPIFLDVRGASGVSLIATAVGAVTDGWLAVTPMPSDGVCKTPSTSNLNFAPAGAIANTVGVAVEPDVAIVCAYSSAPVHLVLDVMATIDGGSNPSDLKAGGSDDRWQMSTAERVLDTRLGSGKQRRLTVTVPKQTRAITVTAVDPDADGFVTLYPADAQGNCAEPPASSLLNVRAGGAAANMTFVPTTTVLCLASSVSTHMIVDRL